MGRHREEENRPPLSKRWWVVGLAILLVFSTSLQARERWVYRYDGSAQDEDDGLAIVCGLDGYIYAAGRVNYTDTNTDLVVVSFSPAGDTMWFFRYDGPGGQWDGAYCLAYGEDYNLYVGGNTSTTDSTQAFAVISLNSTGDTNWIYARDVGYFADGAFAITCGSDGNVYAAGRTRCDFFGAALAVISLSSAGDTNWVYEWDAGLSSYDYAGSIAYGADGNIYAAGSGGPDFANSDLLVFSLTPAGDTNWTYSWNGPASSQDGASSLAYGLDGNIYVAGFTYVTGMDHDMVVVSLDTVGDTNWVYTYDGPGNAYDQANSIVYGEDGNLYVAGYSHGIGSDADFAVWSLTTSGDTNWIFRYDGLAGEYDRANSIVYGADGNLYATGYTREFSGDSDLTIICLTTDGELNWTYTYGGPGASHDEAEAVIYGNDGNVYAVGTSYGGTTDDDFAVVSVSGDLSPPPAPELIFPDSGSVPGDADVTLLWHSSHDPGSGVADYTLQYSTNSSFAGADSAVVVDTSFLAVLSDTTHYWRVKATDSVGYESMWSNVWYFTVDTEPPQISNTTVWEDTGFAGPFPVYATITDNNGVEDALLLYRVNGAPLWMVEAMDTAGVPGGQYRSEIPAQTAGSTLEYYIRSQDIAAPPNTALDPEGAPDTSYSFEVILTGLFEAAIHAEHRWFLSRNHPNPFAVSTQIHYGLPEESSVRAAIYNSSGQEIRSLVDSEQGPGVHTVLWDGRDDSGERVPSGFYFLRLQAGTEENADVHTGVRKLCLMR